MTMTGQKQIKREDLGKLRDLAEKLNDTYSPRTRMDLQQKFVRDMSVKYGHESATRLLSRVWRLADKLKREEARCIR